MKKSKKKANKTKHRSKKSKKDEFTDIDFERYWYLFR